MNFRVPGSNRPLLFLRSAAGLKSAAAGLGLLLLLAGLLPATQVPRMSLEEIVDASESIVQGTVLRSWSAWDDGHKYIWTHYEIQVADKLKGAPPATIVISEPGGTVGETVLQVAGTPQYKVSEEVVVFGERTPLGYLRTCGWGQGKFRVERPAAGGAAKVSTAARGIQLVERPAAARSTPEGASSRAAPAAGDSAATPLAKVSGLDLEQFKSRVREVVAQRASQTAR